MVPRRVAQWSKGNVNANQSDARVAVPQRSGEDASERIQVLATVRVPHPAPAPLFEHERLFVVGPKRGQEKLAMGRQHLRRTGRVHGVPAHLIFPLAMARTRSNS